MKMNKNTLHIIGSCLISATMTGSLVVTPIFADEATSTANGGNPTEKTETVYATLNSDGSVADTVVSSWLHDADGIVNITEELDETNVENVKTDEEPAVHGNTYTWNAEGTDVYYQGDSDKELPVGVSIRYEMDGQQMSAKQMQGKSGHAKITISFTNKESKLIQSGGKTINVHPAYLAGGIMNMKSENYSNITCNTGKIMSDGTNQVLAFASIPGLEDTLESAGLSQLTEKLDAYDDCVIEADVNDFDAGSIVIGMTSDFDLEDISQVNSISDLSGSISQIVSASDQLLDGSKQLYDGTTQLKTQAEPLTSASSSVDELSAALLALDSGTQTLNTGVQAYTTGVNALDEGNKQLYGIVDGVNTVKYNVNHTTVDETTGVEVPSTDTLLSGAQQLQAGLQQLEDQTSSIDENQLDTLDTQIQQSLQAMQAMQTMLETDSGKLSGLNDQLTEAQSQLAALSQDSTLNTQMTQLLTDIAAVNAKIEADNKIVDSDNDIIDKEVANINSQIDDINKQIASIQTTVDSANSSISSAYSQANAALDAAAAATEDESAKQAILSAKLGAAPQASVSVSTIEHITADDLTKLDTIDGSAIQSDAAAIQKTIESLGGSLKTMQSSLTSASTTLSELSTDLSTSITTLQQMDAMIKNVNIGGTDYKTLIMSLKAASKQLSDGSDSLVSGIETLDTGLQTLSTQSKSAIDAINEGSSQLASNSSTLSSGTQTLADSTSLLAAQKSQLDEMSEGLVTLGDALETLNSGAEQLYSGQQQFSDEAMKPLQEMADLTEAEVAILQDTFNSMKQMTEENSTFGGAPEGAETKVNYVLRTSTEN